MKRRYKKSHMNFPFINLTSYLLDKNYLYKDLLKGTKEDRIVTHLTLLATLHILPEIDIRHRKGFKPFIYLGALQNLTGFIGLPVNSTGRIQSFIDDILANKQNPIPENLPIPVPYSTKPIPFEATKRFLYSDVWHKVRYTAIVKNNGCCECCGRGKQNGTILHVDHIKPRKKYPELALDPNNLQVLCEDCNRGKGNWDETDWRKL